MADKKTWMTWVIKKPWMKWAMNKNLDDMADTVADVGSDHDLRESLDGLLLDHLQIQVRLEYNNFVRVEYC